MTYVDGFVTPVPRANRAAYETHVAAAAAIFADLGAGRLVECWADDVPPGEHTDFPARSRWPKGRTCCSVGSNIPTARPATR